MTEANAPLGINEAWFSPEQQNPVDPLLRNWLLDTGSLTERLQSHCRQFDVNLLFQDYGSIGENERTLLYGEMTEEPEATQIREVILKGNNRPWVFARSLMPASFLTEGLSELATLGNQPLGKIIFNDPRFKRQAFQLVECKVSGNLQRALQIRADHSLWGRRSLFHFQHFRIMVAEVFLPESPAYSNLEI